MHSNDWNKQDDFTLQLYSPNNPLDRGQAGLNEVLDFVESLDVEVRPDLVYLSRRRRYSRQLVHEKLEERRFNNTVSLNLFRSRPPDEDLGLTFFDEGAEDTRFYIEFKLRPFSFVREEGYAKARADYLVSLVRAFAQRFPISYGLAHSYTDFSMGCDPHRTNARAPKRIYEAYWLNVYGARLVEELGRQRLLSTPAAHLEELPGGSVMWLTRPMPADFDSEEARLAQARALVHLRPELKWEDTLATLRQRSLAFVPIPVEFDPDVADILWWEVEHRGLAEQRRNVEHFKSYRPPPVSEWLPAADAPAPDVDSVRQTIAAYEGSLVNQLILHLRKDIPLVAKRSLMALPQVDYHLWHFGWGGGRKLEEDKELFIPLLGAWLGFHLVHQLGGRWVPRRNWEESMVVVGDRAWLPFLRARHALQGRQAPLDYSCTQLFRVAQRLARAQAH